MAEMNIKVFNPDNKPLERILSPICEHKTLIKHAEFIKRLVKDEFYNLAAVQAWLLHQILLYDGFNTSRLPKDWQSGFGRSISRYAFIRGGYKKHQETYANDIISALKKKAYNSATHHCSELFAHSFDEKTI